MTSELPALELVMTPSDTNAEERFAELHSARSEVFAADHQDAARTGTSKQLKKVIILIPNVIQSRETTIVDEESETEECENVSPTCEEKRESPVMEAKPVVRQKPKRIDVSAFETPIRQLKIISNRVYFGADSLELQNSSPYNNGYRDAMYNNQSSVTNATPRRSSSPVWLFGHSHVHVQTLTLPNALNRLYISHSSFYPHKLLDASKNPFLANQERTSATTQLSNTNDSTRRSKTTIIDGRSLPEIARSNADHPAAQCTYSSRRMIYQQFQQQERLPERARATLSLQGTQVMTRKSENTDSARKNASYLSSN